MCGVLINRQLIRKRNYFKRYYSIRKFDEIPGPKSWPLIGTLHNYLPFIGTRTLDKLHRNGEKNYRKYGPIVREQIVPNLNLIYLFKPEDMEILFRNEGKYPMRRSHLPLEKYRMEKPNIYNTPGLLPTNGPEWFRLRTVFQRNLTSPQSVYHFLPIVNEVIEEWFQRLDSLKNGSDVDYLPELSRLFLELTGVAILDIRFNAFQPEEYKNSKSRTSRLIKSAEFTNSFILKADNGLQLWKKFNTSKYRKFQKAQEFMENVAIDMLALKMSLFHEKKANEPETLLESYLNSPELDFKDIIGIVCDFLLAGIDTSTYSTSFLLYHLANNIRVQEKLYEESCKLIPNPGDDLTIAAYQNARYAKAVLKESFRLNPISIGIGRILQDDACFSGYHVPAGTVVVTQNQVSCRLPEYFQDPLHFIPERWLRDDQAYRKTHPFLLLPFGFGPRSCIARRLAELNMITLLLKLIRNYKLKWIGTRLDSLSKLINRPDSSILLKFKRR